MYMYQNLGSRHETVGGARKEQCPQNEKLAMVLYHNRTFDLQI